MGQLPEVSKDISNCIPLTLQNRDLRSKGWSEKHMQCGFSTNVSNLLSETWLTRQDFLQVLSELELPFSPQHCSRLLQSWRSFIRSWAVWRYFLLFFFNHCLLRGILLCNEDVGEGKANTIFFSFHMGEFHNLPVGDLERFYLGVMATSGQCEYLNLKYGLI